MKAEASPFQVLGRNLSCVGAVIIPETAHNTLVSAFVERRDSWAGSLQEVKGSTLGEQQTADTISLLVAHGCLFFVTATEMSLNSNAYISEFQRKQAEYITENISGAQSGLLRRQLFRLRRMIEELSSQLFLQSVLLTDLVRKVIDLTSIHFAIRKPM